MVRIEKTNVNVYPDLTIVCGPVDHYQDNPNVITNPTVMMEVLSESTALYDRTGKFRHYQQIPSLQEYVLIEQKEPHIDIFRRNEQGLWVLQSYDGLETELEIAALGVRIGMQRIYHRVEFQGKS